MKRPDTPFPKHWRYYIVLKWTVIALAVALYALAAAVGRASSRRPVGAG